MIYLKFANTPVLIIAQSNLICLLSFSKGIFLLLNLHTFFGVALRIMIGFSIIIGNVIFMLFPNFREMKGCFEHKDCGKSQSRQKLQCVNQVWSSCILTVLKNKTGHLNSFRFCLGFSAAYLTDRLSREHSPFNLCPCIRNEIKELVKFQRVIGHLIGLS